MSEERRAELAANLAKVNERIALACEAAGRAREEVTLIVVTKTYPASDVLLLSELGVRNVAENRDQEAAPKAEQCARALRAEGVPAVVPQGLEGASEKARTGGSAAGGGGAVAGGGAVPPSLTWHFVGQLQTNKAKSVVRYADYVHSVDRLRLVSALSSAAVASGREIGCLLQVALDAGLKEASGRGGAPIEEIPRLADAVAEAPGLRLEGVMTVAPLAGPFAGEPRAAFEKLADTASRLRVNHPAATMVSAGMSDDLEDAVAAGATHVRIGTAVLGVRSRLR